jgi:ferrous iron transport protein B
MQLMRAGDKIMQKLLVALAGNPNAGKSTLFNALTASNQHVGNWPGKTVAKQEGVFYTDGCEVTVVDLPGAYSLTAYSPEEVITREFLLQQRPALVVNVVDAANLERNLYLTVQLLEMRLPLLVLLNMIDAATQRGITIDHDRLSQALQTPVLCTVAHQRNGIEAVKAQIVRMARQEETPLYV